MENTNQMPREDGLDHTLTLMREGYRYILNRRQSFHSDVFETRLLGKKAICMGGKEAAELFYDNEKFKRTGAAPNRALETLFGKGGVQGLDGQAHRDRKNMYMSLMTPEHLGKLSGLVKKKWELAADKWVQQDQVIFYEEVKELLCRAACEWAGVPIGEDKIKELTKHLGAMFESSVEVGPKHWAGRNARNQVEQSLEKLIEQVREGKVNPPEHTALYVFSMQRDFEGKLLDVPVAAVEVINILRPIVAVAIYINFVALAIHHHPEEKERVKSGDENDANMFVQEVRRYYPFFPFVAALVKKDFSWKGVQFEEGTLAILDLYGTNHDSKVWANPDDFRPERFASWEDNLYDFIPQGGGDYFTRHRCPGEQATIEIMKASLEFLVNRIDYDFPDQDLSYSLTSMPSIPHSKIVIENVRRKM